MLHKVNVIHHTLTAIAETGVGGSNVVHHRGKCHAVGGEAVAPSQGGIGPVHHESQFIVAFAHPVD